LFIVVCGKGGELIIGKYNGRKKSDVGLGLMTLVRTGGTSKYRKVWVHFKQEHQSSKESGLLNNGGEQGGYRLEAL